MWHIKTKPLLKTADYHHGITEITALRYKYELHDWTTCNISSVTNFYAIGQTMMKMHN